MQDSCEYLDDNEIESYNQKDFLFEEGIGSIQVTPEPMTRPVNPMFYQMVNAGGGEEVYSSRRLHLSVDRDTLSSIGDSFSEAGMGSEDEDGHRNLKSAFLSMSVEDPGGEERRSICRKRAYSHSRKAVMLFEREKKMKWDEDLEGQRSWPGPPQIAEGMPQAPASHKVTPVASASSSSYFTSLGGGSADSGDSRNSSRRSSCSSLSTSMEQENHLRS